MKNSPFILQSERQGEEVIEEGINGKGGENLTSSFSIWREHKKKRKMENCFCIQGKAFSYLISYKNIPLLPFNFFLHFCVQKKSKGMSKSWEKKESNKNSLPVILRENNFPSRKIFPLPNEMRCFAELLFLDANLMY